MGLAWKSCRRGLRLFTVAATITAALLGWFALTRAAAPPLKVGGLPVT